LRLDGKGENFINELFHRIMVIFDGMVKMGMFLII